MLVLTRKIGEEIVIDEDIRVKVVEIRRGRIRLGIVAPRNRRVERPRKPPPIKVSEFESATR
ncbi:MAG: carbon storage regulator [Planctomycetaceae bacterium]|nr:carbon storage regulator [Planctomycetaceae bacterium]